MGVFWPPEGAESGFSGFKTLKLPLWPPCAPSAWCCSGPPTNPAHLGPWHTHPDPAVSFRQSKVRQWACYGLQRVQKAASVASKPAARKMKIMKISSMADANDQNGGSRAQDTCCVLRKWFVPFWRRMWFGAQPGADQFSFHVVK